MLIGACAITVFRGELAVTDWFAKTQTAFKLWAAPLSEETCLRIEAPVWFVRVRVICLRLQDQAGQVRTAMTPVSVAAF